MYIVEAEPASRAKRQHCHDSNQGKGLRQWQERRSKREGERMKGIEKGRARRVERRDKGTSRGKAKRAHPLVTTFQLKVKLHVIFTKCVSNNAACHCCLPPLPATAFCLPREPN